MPEPKDINIAPSQSYSEITDKDYIFLSKTGVTLSKADIDDVAKYIIEKYGGTTLKGEAQTVQNAVASLSTAVTYTNVSDWDEFKAANTRETKYGYSLGGTAAHAPFSGEDATFVGHVAGASALCSQHLIVQGSSNPLNVGRQFIRIYSSDAWGDWNEIGRCNNQFLPTNTSFDSLIQPGIFMMNANYTYTNGPGFNGVVEIIRPIADGSYCIQRVTNQEKVAIRYKSASGGTSWSSWVIQPLNRLLNGGTDGKSVYLYGPKSHLYFENTSGGANVPGEIWVTDEVDSSRSFGLLSQTWKKDIVTQTTEEFPLVNGRFYMVVIFHPSSANSTGMYLIRGGNTNYQAIKSGSNITITLTATKFKWSDSSQNDPTCYIFQ